MSYSEEESIIRNFLKDRKVVLFQPSPTILFHLDKIFNELDFEPVILKIKDLEKLQEIVEKDEDLFLLVNTSKEGLDFIVNSSKQATFNRKSTILIAGEVFDELLSLNFGRYKIDDHIIDPLSTYKMKYHLVRAIESSLLRKNYTKITDSAIKLITNGKNDEARDYLQIQLRISRTPELAHCLLAELLNSQSYYAESLHHYIKSIQLQPYNFRALKGLYELFMSTDHYEEAYSTLRKLLTLFPADSDDLCQALRLCIKTNQIRDMEKLIELYFRQRDTSEKIDRYAAAAIAVYCQYLVSKKEFKAARTEIEKLRKFRFQMGPFLTPLILMLRDLNKVDDVAFLMKLFRKEDQRYKDYKLATYYYYCLSESEQETSRFALRIISEGVTNQLLFRETIKRLHRLGDSQQAEKIKNKARSLWPEFTS